MKQKFLIGVLSITTLCSALPVFAQVKTNVTPQFAVTTFKGNSAFASSFSNTATGRNDVNAYLLSYLTTLIYPQYLAMVANNPDESYVNRLHSDIEYFESEFKKYTSSLFFAPQYDFIHEGFPTGYDPEAMVISTTETIYVVFRGTDRVASNRVNSFHYDWGEWLTTDFNAAHLSTPDLTGKVQAGMWLSLEYAGFKDKLLDVIKRRGGGAKKVWVCGHSLGGGQAQLYAMYMAKKGITPQGVYVYASPSPGTQEFADELERILPGGRLQRFDFINDPVTTMAPYILGYRRAGVRVFYNDLRTIRFGAEERGPQEGLSLFPGLMGAAANTIADIVNGKINSKFRLDVLTPGGSPMCYHHPLWYQRAAYNQLTAAEKDKLPRPLATPDPTMEGCDVMTVERGKSSDPFVWTKNLVSAGIDGTAAVIEEGLERLTFVANAVVQNATGTAIAEGDYYIKCYPSLGRLGLNEQDGLNNGSSLRLTGGRSKVTIERFGAIGYIIKFGRRDGKDYVLDSQSEDLFDDGSTTIQLWEKNLWPGASANQRWLFIRVKDNKYVIRNLANQKLLDAHNNCSNSSTTSTSVKTWNAISNEQTQIWTLEKPINHLNK